MGVVRIEPNADNSEADWPVTGAAGQWEALADSSDSSYITPNGLGAIDPLQVDFETPTIPAGGAVLGARLNLRTDRGNLFAGSARFKGSFYTSGAAALINTLATWYVPTSTYVSDLVADINTTDLAMVLTHGYPGKVYQAWIDVIYADKAATEVTAPAGTLTTSNRPIVRWTNTLDLYGGAQTRYQVKIFDATNFGDFSTVDPDADTASVESGIQASTASAWRPTDALPDDDYRVYVRVAQSVFGNLHWSDWESSDFEVDVAVPAVPSLAVVGDDDNARITITVSENSGAADTDWWEVESSTTGAPGTWTPIVAPGANGVVPNPTPNAAGVAVVHDYESANSVETFFRARAVTDHGDDVTVSSEWADTESDQWSSPDWWIKHPAFPSLNMPITVASQDGYSRPSRDGHFQGIGSSQAVVVSDYPSPPTGPIVFDLDNQEQRDQLDALLETLASLLIQAPPGTHWVDRWVHLSDLDNKPHVDKLAVSDSLASVQWIEVDRPPEQAITERVPQLFLPTTSALARWEERRDQTVEGTRQSHIAIVGDSIVYGYTAFGASNPKYLKSWPGRLRAMLDQVYGSAGTGFVPAVEYTHLVGAADPRFTFTGTVTDEALGFFKFAAWKLAAGSGQLEFAVPDVDEFVVVNLSQGGGLNTAYIDGVSIGTYRNIYTGGTSPTFPKANGTHQKIIETHLPAGGGSHTLKVIPPAATNHQILTMIEGRVTEPGTFRVSNAGVNAQTLLTLGADGTTNNNETNGTYGLPHVDMLQADLLIIALGINDWLGEHSIADVKEMLTNLITRQRASGTNTGGGRLPAGDVMLLWNPQPDQTVLVHPDPSWDEYRQAYYEVAEEQNCALLDLGDLWGPYDVANAAGYYADSIHPTDAGLYQIAATVNAAIMS